MCRRTMTNGLPETIAVLGIVRLAYLAMSYFPSLDPGAAKNTWLEIHKERFKTCL